MNEEILSLTEGIVWKKLLRFAIPIFLGNLFQQMYNAVDSLVVGNFCGNEALAAVSSSMSLQQLFIGFFQGAFIGASVLISRSFGAKDREGMDEAIHTTVVFALVMAKTGNNGGAGAAGACDLSAQLLSTSARIKLVIITFFIFVLVLICWTFLLFNFCGIRIFWAFIFNYIKLSNIVK